MQCFFNQININKPKDKMDYNLRIPKSIKYLKEDQNKIKRRRKETQD